MIVWLVGVLQLACAARVLHVLIGSAGRERIRSCDRPATDRITVILPVLNEKTRVGACLRGLISQPPEVTEILVVDGGSTDGTQSIVTNYCARDARVKLVDASPTDHGWTGKSWGLHVGLQHTNRASDWVLCVDADVRVSPLLVRSLLAHARRTGNSAFSVATLQKLGGILDAIVHPSLLATLIYRYGIPGSTTRDPHQIQANGQCFISRRETLIATEAVRAAQRSLCEDVTIARRLAECGETVGFYETDRLVEVRMYADWRDTWNNWPRSLPMRDQYFGWREATGLAQVLVVQALPLPLLLLGAILALPGWFLTLNAALVCLRLGALAGLARAYYPRPWSYWLSPICDLPAALKLIRSALARRHSWRGRTYTRARGGTFVRIK